MTRPVPHEITLLAFVTNDDGTLSLTDVVDTSRRFAPFFVRRFRKYDRPVTHLAAIAPGVSWSDAIPRPIGGAS